MFIYFEPERELSHVSLPPSLWETHDAHAPSLYVRTFARVGHGQIKYLHLHLHKIIFIYYQNGN